MLAREPGRISFNGLRRGLSAHPESLSRSLRRLGRGGQIVRTDAGYVLADGFHPEMRPVEDRVFRPVASVELGREVTADLVYGTLAGRWFGRLRWVGVYERESHDWLVWSVDGARGHVLLGVEGRTLRVGIEAEGDSADDDLEDRARELLVRGLERIPRAGRPDRTAVALAVEDPPPMRYAS